MCQSRRLLKFCSSGILGEICKIKNSKIFEESEKNLDILGWVKLAGPIGFKREKGAKK